MQIYVIEMRVHAIEESTLSLLLEMGKSSWPNEYMVLLGAENGVINVVYPLPGSDGGSDASYIHLDMMPLGMSYAGTAHSHPYCPTYDAGMNSATDLSPDTDEGWDHDFLDGDDLIGDDDFLAEDDELDKSRYLPYTPSSVPPYNILQPSDTDYATFASLGQVHIIVGSPYDDHSWRAFSRDGKEISLEVVSS